MKNIKDVAGLQFDLSDRGASDSAARKVSNVR